MGFCRFFARFRRAPTSLPVVGGGGQLAWVRHRRAGEALEGRRGGVDAERHPVRVELVLDEFVQPVFHFGDAGEVVLPGVVEEHLGNGLEVSRVLAHARAGAVAAGAHAGVVSEPALVQVGVVERLQHPDSLLGVEGEHLAEQVDGLVGGAGAQRVERGDAGGLAALGQHVALRRLAGVPHVGEGGGAQQVGDQVQLLDWGRGLQHDIVNILGRCIDCRIAGSVNEGSVLCLLILQSMWGTRLSGL